MTENKIKEIISQMTLEEKAALLSGLDNQYTKGVERLGVPRIRMMDGPNGLRDEENISATEKVTHPSVCFPSGALWASSFDTALAERFGEALGDVYLAKGVDIILGPALNLKRSPLCGRNFEYLSEDPLAAGEMSAGYINGVQGKGIGVSAKHFFANSQENRRQSSSSNADERTLREMYLTNFEIAVKKSQPWTIMASYNKINGVYATENKKYIGDVLYGEWGFEGLVVSDWGAVYDRLAAAKGDTTLTMPYAANDNELVEAVKSGNLPEHVLDVQCERMLHLTFRAVKNRKKTELDPEVSLSCARQIAEESIILLKNEKVLPLTETQKIAFIGVYAKKPRYQGGGSAHINSFKVISALEAASEVGTVQFALGYNDNTEETDTVLLNEAVRLAKSVDTAVVFAGLPDIFESEGYDRDNMRMPRCQNELIEAVAAANPNTVVVLHNGAPVEMPWADKVKGIVETYLGGDAVGAAVVNILYGKVNPSGRLAETFPKKLEDNPSYLFYGGEYDTVEYREGVFAGYRYYESKKMDVLFPFGHGLSYTSFAYSNLAVSSDNIDAEKETVTVTVDVRNTGALAGKEVVQLYIAPHKGAIIRPVKELKGFRKIYLEPGETKTVSFTLDKRSFAYWNIEINDWHVESGQYEIVIGMNAHDVLMQKTIAVKGQVFFFTKLTHASSIGDLLVRPKGLEFWNGIQERFLEAAKKAGFQEADPAAMDEDKKQKMQSMLNGIPINVLCLLIPEFTLDNLNNILEEINNTYRNKEIQNG
jgi:beta-glucosidase